MGCLTMTSRTSSQKDSVSLVATGFASDRDKSELLSRSGGHTQIKGSSLALSPNGQILASADSIKDKTIKVWDLRTGELRRTLAGHSDSVVSVAFSPDNHLLASGSKDKTIKIWDLNTGELLHTLAGHTSSVVAVTFRKDSQTLVSATKERIIEIWDLTRGNILNAFDVANCGLSA